MEMGSRLWLVKHGNKIFVRHAFFEQSLLEPFTRIVDEFVKIIPIRTQPFGNLVQGHPLKSVGDKCSPLQGSKLGADKSRQ